MPSSVNCHLPTVLFQRIVLEVWTFPDPSVVRITRIPPSPAVILLPVLKSISLSATESVVVLTVVWVPLTVRLPAIVRVPSVGLILLTVSTYVLTAAWVGHLLSLFCDNVPSVENSLIEAPIRPPIEPNCNDSRPFRSKADESRVTFPVAWST